MPVGLINKYKEFIKNRQKKNIARNLKLIQNPKAIKEDRFAAIHFFCDLEDIETAVSSLLKRFEYSLEHGINDTREKELAMQGIIDHGKGSLPCILKHLQQTTKIAWPLKVYQKLGTEQELIKALDSCLNYGDVSFDQKLIDKNYDILCYLRDYKLPDNGEKYFHFLDEHDERLRFAATEVLLDQENEEVYVQLEKYLLDDSAENIRLLQAIASKFVQLNRVIKNKENFKVGPLAPGFSVAKDYTLKETRIKDF